MLKLGYAPHPLQPDDDDGDDDDADGYGWFGFMLSSDLGHTQPACSRTKYYLCCIKRRDAMIAVYDAISINSSVLWPQE